LLSLGNKNELHPWESWNTREQAGQEAFKTLFFFYPLALFDSHKEQRQCQGRDGRSSTLKHWFIDADLTMRPDGKGISRL
jgi:hypothetical protein